MRLLPLNMTAPASSSISCSKAVFHQEVVTERGCDSILATFDFARRSDSTSYSRLDAKAAHQISCEQGAAAFSERAYELTQKLIAAFDAVQPPGQWSNVEVPIYRSIKGF